MICKKILNRIRNIIYVVYYDRKSFFLTNQIKEKHSCNRIYYFCPPCQSNLGDQAQYLCWMRLLKEWYPDFEIISIPQRYCKPSTIQLIKWNINQGDKIFIHSGYLIYDPHPELHFICSVVDAFHDFHVTILPQTVNLVDQHTREHVAKCFNAHPDLTLICRDEVSYENSQTLFNNCQIRLMPDVVTSLIGDGAFFEASSKRRGVLFCIRNDGEKFYSDSEIRSLRKRFGNIKADFCDTTIKEPAWVWDRQRARLINQVLNKFSKYQVIITDRYHGTIFSQIANTPVVVLSSADHKLSSGVKWFPPKLFDRCVYFAPDLDKAYDLASMILEKRIEIKNNSYFKDCFYAKPL